MLLDRFGLFRDEANVAELSELGVLFLLFEQGLELSFDRLKALAKYVASLDGDLKSVPQGKFR